jgi:hypothetical protein
MSCSARAIWQICHHQAGTAFCQGCWGIISTLKGEMFQHSPRQLTKTKLTAATQHTQTEAFSWVERDLRISPLSQSVDNYLTQSPVSQQQH